MLAYSEPPVSPDLKNGHGGVRAEPTFVMATGYASSVLRNALNENPLCVPARGEALTDSIPTALPKNWRSAEVLCDRIGH